MVSAATDPDATPAPLAAQTSREKILEVAEALFARRGYAGVGIREVADAAGLGKSSLFHHFPSKLVLYSEVLNGVLRRFEERFQTALAPGGTPSERLDRWVDASIDGLAEHPPSARLLLRALIEDEDLPPEADGQPELVTASQLIESILDQGIELIREGVAAGEFRPVSAAHTIQTLVGATVFHFASGEFGEGLIGHPLLSAEAVRRRREEVKNLLHQGLAVRAPEMARKGEA